MLLDWLGARHRAVAYVKAAQAIEAAIDSALKDPATRTADLGGRLGTRAFAERVAGLIG